MAHRRTKSQSWDAEWLRSDPRTRNWIVRCVACQRIGDRADAPEEFFGRYFVVRDFEPLHLDAAGLCVDCRKAKA
jgi:hypothetical protein